jgi:ATP-dependent DNA helicase RecG
MDLVKFENALKIGETAAIEFKRAGGTIEMDTFETVCSFSNRFGGDIYLGVLDNGTVVGIPENAAPSMVKNFISAIGNPDLFSPTLYLEPEIFKYRKKTLIHIHVPSSGEVHSFKKRIYDRMDEADVKVSATAKIAQMYIRKQEIYTERRMYPYVKLKDLRLDLLPMVRILAKNNGGGSHLWEKLSNMDLLKSAGLYAEDHATGKNGFNLAAVMLLGRDEVIRDVSPAYQTDALVRKVNVDRYDDRLTVVTNLVESFEQLFKFATLHLPDKFYVEGAERKSLRNIVAREMLVNTLMHREYSSAYQAKFVIEQDRM